ncbi:LptF/LptG family permease [Shigella flexneri]
MSNAWKTDLTPDKLGVVALDPDALSIERFAQLCEVSKSSSRVPGRYRSTSGQNCCQPLSVAVMMLMALSFILAHCVAYRSGMRVVTGIGFGFVFGLDRSSSADVSLWHAGVVSALPQAQASFS